MSPAAGVTVARPATAPVAKPTEVGLPMVIFSMSSHASAAAQAAAWVLMIGGGGIIGCGERGSTELKPNQPAQSMPAPIMVSAGEWGSICCLGKPERLPISSAAINAETPAGGVHDNAARKIERAEPA